MFHENQAGITAVATLLPSPELGAIAWNPGTTDVPAVFESKLRRHINGHLTAKNSI
jgi:hypothetical protein